MSTTVTMHTKRNEIFEADGYLTTGSYERDYAVIKIETREKRNGSNEELIMFPSYAQVKQMHKALSKLMRHIAAVEKAQKTVEALQAIERDPISNPISVDENDFPF